MCHDNCANGGAFRIAVLAAFTKCGRCVLRSSEGPYNNVGGRVRYVMRADLHGLRSAPIQPGGRAH